MTPPSAKSVSDKEKHGIDFVEAQALWEDDDRIEIPARSGSEPRFALLAQLGDQLWAAFFTLRSDNVRIISARRARPNERNLYEGGRT